MRSPSTSAVARWREYRYGRAMADRRFDHAALLKRAADNREPSDWALDS